MSAASEPNRADGVDSTRLTALEMALHFCDHQTARDVVATAVLFEEYLRTGRVGAEADVLKRMSVTNVRAI